MDNPGYVTLTRQSGLLKEMRIIANNVANVSTTGFRRETTVFAEMIEALQAAGGSLSMTAARVRDTDFAQGGVAATGGTYDFAIEGDGFFQVLTPDGLRLTRAGAFVRDAEGELATFEGHKVLDPGGAPVFLPPDAAEIAVAPDGSLSADGRLIGAIGVVRVEDVSALTRQDGVLFRADADLLPAENATVFQGYVESGNVQPLTEMARMIEVQRAYELGAKFLDREDERIRQAVRVMGGG